MPDGLLEMLGEILHLIQTNIMCMVAIMVFGIVVALIFALWYMKRIMGQEIFVHGGRWDKDKK